VAHQYKWHILSLSLKSQIIEIKTRKAKIALFIFLLYLLSVTITSCFLVSVLRSISNSKTIATTSLQKHLAVTEEKPKVSSSQMATMESLISLVNRIQRACTILGDYGGDSGGAAAASLPTLWESLPSVAVVGGQVLLSLYISTHTVFLLYIFVCFGNLKWTRLFLKVSLYFPLIFLHCFSVHRAPCTHTYRVFICVAYVCFFMCFDIFSECNSCFLAVKVCFVFLFQMRICFLF